MIKQIKVVGGKNWIKVGSIMNGKKIDKIIEEVPRRFQIIGEDGKHLGVVVATNYYVVYF